MSTDPLDFDIAAFMEEVAEAERGPSEETVEKLIPKIRKLLNLAEKAGTEEEAKAFNEKAARLSSKYGIDALMLQTAEPDKPRTVADRWITVPGPYADDRGLLLYAVLSALGAKAVYLPGRGFVKYHVFGIESDLIRTELLFNSLLVQMQRDLERALPGRDVHTSRNVFSRDFMAGFRHVVSQRLKDAENNARTEAETDRGETPGGESTSVALALYNRNDAVQGALVRVYPSLKKGRSRRARSGTGVLAGMEAGQRANLGGTDLTASSARSLGR